MNGPNKLECYITQYWKGLQGTNAPPYWAHLEVMNKYILSFLGCGGLLKTSHCKSIGQTVKSSFLGKSRFYTVRLLPL